MTVLVSLTSTAPAQSGPPPPPPSVWSDALNFWPLERPPWSSVFGDPARAFTNLATAPSWDYSGTALSIDTNVCAFLDLGVYESGWTNLIVGQTNGSLSFWYQANYTSVADGGTGPGDWAALLDIGAYTTNASAGCWLLAVDPSASNLVFIAQSEGTNQFVFDAPIDLDAGDWHNICLTYTATNCCLYLEGQFATNAGPIACWPDAGQCVSNGIFVGSMSAAGDYQCRGQMQYLETFDYPRAATQVADDYATVSAFIGYWGGALPALAGGFHPPSTSGMPVPPGMTNSGGDGVTNWAPPVIPPQVASSNLFLYISQQSNFVTVTFTNTIAGNPYVLLSSTNITGPWLINQFFPQAPSTNFNAQPIPVLSNTAMFFRGLKAGVPGTLRWKVQLSNPNLNIEDGFGHGLDATPGLSLDGTTIYIASAQNQLFAIDLFTGATNWQDNIFTTNAFNTNAGRAGGVGSVAVGAGGVIYIGYLDGNLYSINPNGTTNWIRNTGNSTAVYSTPALSSNGIIYVGTDQQDETGSSYLTGLTAFSASNGYTNWFFAPQPVPFYGYCGNIYSSPVVGADGTIYFLAEDYRLYAVTPSGNVKWFLPVPAHAMPDSSVAIGSDGTLYVGSDSPYVYAVNPDGSLRWAFNANAFDWSEYEGAETAFSSSPSIGPDGTIYLGSGTDAAGDTGTLYALNPDGGTNWVFTPLQQNATISSPAIASNSTVYIGSIDGNLYAVTNGGLDWSFPTPNAYEIISSPLIAADGTVIFGCEDGYLYAVWGSAPPATNAPWPTFHLNSQRTGLQSPPTAPAEDCGAPFLSNGTNDGHGNFTFLITGWTNNPNPRWNVYASTNLIAWTNIGTNVGLDPMWGTNTFTDTHATNLPMRFYELSTNNCCSRVIGFVNLTIVPGTNLIANQLCQVDDSILNFTIGTSEGAPMNTLDALFLESWGHTQDPTQIFQWSGTNLESAAYNDQLGPTWLPFPGGGDITLLPGSSVVVSNGTGKSFTASFVGVLRQEQVFQIQPGTSYLSATLPVAGPITNVTGYVPRKWDTIQLWNVTNYVSHTYYGSNTWSNGVPELAVGQGFVLITTNTNSYTWTNTWQNLQPCP
jgi:outer membrane protein assembly factor BamB